MRGGKTYSKINDPVAANEITNRSTLQKDLTTKWNEHAGTGSLKYMVLHLAGVGSEEKRCVSMRSLVPFHGQAVDEMFATEMEDVEGGSSARARRRRVWKNSATEKYSVEMT